MTRCGERHPRAVLSDHEATLLVELHQEGYSLGWLAGTFEISKSQVRRIVTGKQRLDLGAVRVALPVRRKCHDRLPVLPPHVDGHDAGLRAMHLIAFTLG